MSKRKPYIGTQNGHLGHPDKLFTDTSTSSQGVILSEAKDPCICFCRRLFSHVPPPGLIPPKAHRQKINLKNVAHFFDAKRRVFIYHLHHTKHHTLTIKKPRLHHHFSSTPFKKHQQNTQKQPPKLLRKNPHKILHPGRLKSITPI
jgi:hypothetical protein